MRTAIVHDWIVSSVGGSEKCLAAIHSLFPSPLFTLITNPQELKNTYFEKTEIQSSFIQNLPFSAKKFRNYLPLFPLAIEQFDLSNFDLILSSSHCVAKGVLTHPQQLHICYCYTPVRYAWDLTYQYLRETKLNRGIKGALAKFILHYIRNWDQQASRRVDQFVAISRHVADRIRKYYGRDAEVIYPPVDTSFFQMETNKEDYYFTASRFVPYKRIDLIVEAFSEMPEKKLVVLGDGPENEKIRSKAKKNIEFLGYQPDEELKKHLQKAKAFVFAANEDFGILPVEAMACGTPVIAFKQGAVRETVVEEKTGVFFDEQTVPSLRKAIDQFETMLHRFSPLEIRRHAEKFDLSEFNRQFQSFVIDKYQKFSEAKRL